MAKTYRVGIIGRTGKGNYGHGLDTVWSHVPQCEVVAVADDNAAGLAKAKEKTGAKRAYADYREMLDKEKPDIVAICQRWLDKHHEMALAVADHGCHIYMEKPFTPTLKEADEIIHACEMRHLKLQVAHANRFTPQLEIAKKLIAAGEIGDVLEIRARGKEDARRGGGEDLWVLGTHMLDLMRALAGGVAGVEAESSERSPQSARSLGAPVGRSQPPFALSGDVVECFATVTEKGKPVTAANVVDGNEGIGPLAGDGVDAVYRFGNGITGFFASHRGMGGSPSRFGLKVYGSKGVIAFQSGYLRTAYLLRDPSWSPGRSGKKWLPISSAGVDQPEPIKGESHAGANLAAVHDLIEAIEKDRQPISSMYDARAATEMIVGVFESHRLGGPVSFPLKNRRNPLTMLES